MSINGVAPTYETISSFQYPGARPLYIYVKKAHVGVIPGLKEFVAAWADSWGKDGPLARVGFIASPEDVQAKNKAAATALTTMTGEGLK